MQSVPNQKIVTCYKEPCDKINIYMTLNIKALEHAAQDLSYAAFKLYIYFAKNQDGYCFALSSKDVAQRWAMCRSAYDRCVHELIDKGYLVQDDAVTNHYSFNELPELDSE